MTETERTSVLGLVFARCKQMDKFSAVKADPNRTPEMRVMQGWVEKYLCNRHGLQNAVGNRMDKAGQPLSQALYDINDRQAHVCPFVQDSLDQGLFWIEESSLTEDDDVAIETLMRNQVQAFVQAAPAHDPSQNNQPAKGAVLLKTFLTFFPYVAYKGVLQLFDDIQGRLKSEFVKKGMMIGQFYKGCQQEALYNAKWKPLVTPYPAFAIRYMVKGDKLFNRPGTGDEAEYLKFFP